MIPRGADFPPDSAPPAKRRESATMRHDRPALPAAPSPCRPPSLRQEVGAAPGSRVATLRRPTPRLFSAHAARYDAGRVRPGHDPHGNNAASISLLSSASSGRTAPALHSPDCAAHAPERNGNFSSPKRCGGLANPASALGSSRGLFSISPRKKRTGSVSSRFSLWILSLAAAFSLLNISSGRFPRGFGGAESVFRRFRS